MIHWHRPAVEIYNQVRGLAPWPVAHTTINDKRLKIWRSEVSTKETTEAPGTIIHIGDDTISVACGEGTVLNLKEIQPSGKKQMDVKTFLLGAGKDWKPGLKLGDANETK